MRISEYEIEGNSLTIVNLSDLHLGHSNCDKYMIQNVIEYIRKNKYWWLGGGDYGDAIIPNDPRFDYQSIDATCQTPQEQYGLLESMFEPIANKCLGLLDGNHDIIHWKKHCHNYVEDLANRLGVIYLTIDAYLRFYFTKSNTNFDIYAHHGWTGSRTKAGVINRIYDLANIFPWADLYIMNHVHHLGPADKRASLFVDDEGEIRDKLQWFYFGGSFLRGYMKDHVSYVEEKTYRPSILGSPVLTVIPKEGKHTVSFEIYYKEIR